MYILVGYPRYFFTDKKCFRKAYKTKSKSCKWQYRTEREIKLSRKKYGSIYKEGFWLKRYSKYVFIRCDKLKHKLKFVQ